MPPKKLPQPAKKTASLYKRLSLTPDETSTSLESQELDMRRLAAERGLAVVSVHTDIESGASRTRSGLQDWLDDARKGRADHLLAWHFDRVERGGLAAIGAFLDTVKGIDARSRITDVDHRSMDSHPMKKSAPARSWSKPRSRRNSSQFGVASK